MLIIVGVVGAPFLVPVGGVVGAVAVQHDVEGRAGALPLPQVHLDQGMGQAQAGMPVHRILQAGHRGLAGQVAVALGTAAADQLEQRIGAQRVGVVLVLVPAGDAEDTLRWRTSASMEWWMCWRRHSGTHAASAAQMPTAPSASASQGSPPSEVRRPPSKAASRASAVEVANA